MLCSCLAVCKGSGYLHRIKEQGYGDMIKKRTGLPLSPYFSAAKLAWMFHNVCGVTEKAKEGMLLLEH